MAEWEILQEVAPPEVMRAAQRKWPFVKMRPNEAVRIDNYQDWIPALAAAHACAKRDKWKFCGRWLRDAVTEEKMPDPHGKIWRVK